MTSWALNLLEVAALIEEHDLIGNATFDMLCSRSKRT
jgi:hypothetical protein